MDTVPELETLGLEDIWEQRAIVLIEWGERFNSELPGARIEIRLDYDGDDGRVIEIHTGHCRRAAAVVAVDIISGLP